MDQFNRVPYILFTQGTNRYCLLRQSCPKKVCIEEEVSKLGTLNRCLVMADYMYHVPIVEEGEEETQEGFFKNKG
jgi:hypothetical protein